jgi:hypothetical protein
MRFTATIPPRLVDERERILDYLGEDFLSIKELKTYFPEVIALQ